MLLKNFENSGGAEGAVNYILSMHDHTGKRRAVEPKILKGNPDITKDICKEFCQKFAHKTVSGVLSFRDNEDITDEQKQKLMSDFEKTFLGNMRDKVNILWVEHRDKNNLELHYVINRVDLDSGKSFNPFHFSSKTKELIKLFSAIKNEEFGFKQVEEKPLKTKLTSNEIKCKDKERHGFDNLDTKLKLESALQMLVKNGDIKNRNELITFLTEEAGKTLSRIGEDYISIEVKGGRNIRLKGGIFAKNEDKDYKQIIKEYKESKEDFDINKAVSKLNKLVEQRDTYNTERYTAEKHKPVFTKLAEARQLKQPQDKQPGPTPGTTLPKAQTTALQPVKQPVEATKPDRQGSTPSEPLQASQDKANEPRSHDSPTVSSGISNGVASAMTAVEQAKGKLANAKTFAEQTKARFELAMAMKRLEEEGFKAEEEKKQQQRRLKI
jgi:hypothetical protein